VSQSKLDLRTCKLTRNDLSRTIKEETAKEGFAEDELIVKDDGHHNSSSGSVWDLDPCDNAVN